MTTSGQVGAASGQHRLHGRDEELALLLGMVEAAPTQGGSAIVVRGYAGIGKSSVFSRIEQHSHEAGHQVLLACGVQSESRSPFAGLHQLLQPILPLVSRLPERHRSALEAAFGLIDAAAPDPFLIALATLDLLVEASPSQTLVVLVDDAHWLDRPTCEVLSFIARRVRLDRIVLYLSARLGVEDPFASSQLPELVLEGLRPEAARTVLKERDPDLPAATLERLMRAADGNPLALIEMPLTQITDQPAGPAAHVHLVPLSARLENAFAARFSELARRTRRLLLIAAASDTGALHEVLSATAIAHGEAASIGDLSPAIEAHLITVESTSLHFRHPLVRSAIYQQSPMHERQGAHAALALVLAGAPERSVWHRVAATFGPDDEVAAAVESAAERAQHRGALLTAVATYQRSAQLSEEPATRGDRFLRAAELAFELGRRDVVLALLDDAEPHLQVPLARARMTWIRDSFDDGVSAGPERALELVRSADVCQAGGDPTLALGLLTGAALRCFWGRPSASTREAVVACAQRIDTDDPRLLLARAIGSPTSEGAEVSRRLRTLAGEPDLDPLAARVYAMASAVVGEPQLGEVFGTSSIAGLRRQGRLALLTQVLGVRAWNRIHLGHFDSALADAEEAGRLAEETGQPVWTVQSWAARAVVAGVHGNEDSAEQLSRSAEAQALPGQVSAVLAEVRLARGLTALGSGRTQDAYQEFSRLLDPSDPSFHYVKSPWSIGDLAEAAVLSGHDLDGEGVSALIERSVQGITSRQVQVALTFARPLLAGDDCAERLFVAGLEADLSDFPFTRARLEFAYGSWLRRQRRVRQSRSSLRHARDAFDQLGAVLWSQRAREELRAAGETSPDRVPSARELLTSLEAQIAQMAADGLTNKEIGRELYLSHRTVSSHLYRVFPKLSITSRQEIREALGTKDSRSAPPRPS